MFHKLYDSRIDCLSIMTDMTIGRYISLVESVYKISGGLEGQRGPLKTKTGISIRNRLVEDIRNGAVIPPVVIGAFLDDETLKKVNLVENVEHLLELMTGHEVDRISIIDGMQRTTAMLDAMRAAPALASKSIRVEFWVSTYLNSLIYRMLVLNTGQVPWEIGRQLETVYGQFLLKIKTDLGLDVEIFLMRDERRRAQAGQYQSKNIIELLLLFSSRKSLIDIKDRVAEDFARLDAVETTAHREFLDYFVSCIRLMADLDRSFSRYQERDIDGHQRIKSGKDVFSSFPAMAGFCSAVSIELFDEPGFAINWDETPVKMGELSSSVGHLINRLDNMDATQLRQFLQLSLLEEKLSARSTQVGRFEREFFRRAFQAMFKNASRLQNMDPCWMA